MNTLEDNIKIRQLWFTESEIYIETSDGLKMSHPLSWFPRLQNASKEERENYELSPFGIHWPTLDEDLSFNGFFDYKKEC
ncbi:DUF2442 domain-containing protein [Aequorivita capsosiphonis]|uniref:DUF2442 domain-containing protein n=1 Tax=Aequorivita capsosiphonis TaxID=487317 RepID=UPI000401C6DA|nr:DUF2442 domain-containing protein [Aequorivita capsosiphonis]